MVRGKGTVGTLGRGLLCGGPLLLQGRLGLQAVQIIRGALRVGGGGDDEALSLFRRDLTARLTPLAIDSTSTSSSINLLASHFHAAAGGLSPPLPRHL